PSYGLCLLILARYHVPAGGAAAADGAVSAGGPVGTAGSGAVPAGGPVRAVAAALDGGETPAPCPGCRNPARRGAPAVAEPGGNPPAGQRPADRGEAGQARQPLGQRAEPCSQGKPVADRDPLEQQGGRAHRSP